MAEEIKKPATVAESESVPKQSQTPARAAPATAPTTQTPPQTPAKPQLRSVPTQGQTQPQSGNTPTTRRLKKGELIFKEGENSRAMYFLKAGIIRLFKKKGDAQIELDTVHSGQVLGELAFLDGNPRSASGEALTDCELMEVSGPTFQSVLSRMPDWLKILLKTIVGRLRTASTRIKQLETASTAYDYKEKDGKRGGSHYVYIATNEVLKISSALLLVATRNGNKLSDGIEIRVGLLQRYANQVMGVPVAKITSLLDVLERIGVVSLNSTEATSGVVLKDPDFLEQAITYVNEENLLEPSKRHDLSLKSFFIMSLIAKHLGSYTKDEATGMITVNLAEIKKLETPAGVKELFRMEDFQELVKMGYCTNATIKSSDEMYTSVKAETFSHHAKLQRLVKSIDAMNEQKTKNGR